MPEANGWHRKNTTPAVLARRAKYDSREHRTARRDLAEVVAQGARCWRCNEPLAGQAWHVGHDDHDTSVIRGPECAPCNRRAGARKGARIVNAQRAGAKVVAEFVRVVR